MHLFCPHWQTRHFQHEQHYTVVWTLAVQAAQSYTEIHCQTETSSGRSNYDGSKGGSQVMYYKEQQTSGTRSVKWMAQAAVQNWGRCNTRQTNGHHSDCTSSTGLVQPTQVASTETRWQKPKEWLNQPDNGLD